MAAVIYRHFGIALRQIYFMAVADALHASEFIYLLQDSDDLRSAAK